MGCRRLDGEMLVGIGYIQFGSIETLTWVSGLGFRV